MLNNFQRVFNFSIFFFTLKTKTLIKTFFERFMSVERQIFLSKNSLENPRMTIRKHKSLIASQIQTFLHELNFLRKRIVFHGFFSPISTRKIYRSAGVQRPAAWRGAGCMSACYVAFLISILFVSLLYIIVRCLSQFKNSSHVNSKFSLSQSLNSIISI